MAMRKTGKTAASKSATKTKGRPTTTTSTKAKRPVDGKKAAAPAASTAKVKKPAIPPLLSGDMGRDSKQARLIALLQESTGATIEQMMMLTGWQAHTVRGTISAVLRKKLGLNVTSERPADSGARCYRIAGAAVGA